MKRTNDKELFGPDFLNENFEITENRENGIYKAINELSRNTVYEVVDPLKFELFSLLSRRRERDEFDIIRIHPQHADIRLFMPQNTRQLYFSKKNNNAGSLKIETLLQAGITEVQLQEIEEAGFFLQYHREGTVITLIPSKAFLATLCRQLGIGKLNPGIEPIRDIYLASKLKYADKFTLVYRKYRNIGKAFGCFSHKFSNNPPQTVVFDYKKELEKISGISIRWWKISHFITTVDFAFNHLNVKVGGIKITPGVRLSFSDVGDSSYILQNILLLHGGTIINSEDMIARRHSGTLKVGEMVSQYFQAIYPRLIDAINNLQNMEKIPIRNKKDGVYDVLKRIEFTNALGSVHAKEFYEHYVSVIENEPCSALDVALFVMRIPGLIKKKYKQSAVENVSSCIGKIFKINMRDLEC